ncbi:MAG: ATP-binding cassette domain-containing protein [Myxococcales bacterium]|nr:ATP-binding cassette domain-containing protein [Myxococcales bacterium]
MAPALRLVGLGYRHPTAERDAVSGVSATLLAGQLIVLAGPTGCGKSTLLRLAAGLLQRHGRGRLAGSVLLAGDDPGTLSPATRVRRVALVGQDPDDQRVAATVGDEIAFAAESAGFDDAAIGASVDALLTTLALPGGGDRAVGALSSGQRQRLSIAAALAAGAPVLLLDEPLAHLDPASAAELVERLRALAASGTAVLVVEHRLEPLWRAADRVWVMDQGCLVGDAPPSEIPLALLRRLGLSVPRWLAPEPERPRTPPPPPGPALLDAQRLTQRFPSGEGIHAVSVRAGGGERIALVGPNGAGKSTLLAALAAAPGVARSRLVSVPPNPDLGLFCPTVREELAHAPEERGLTDIGARVAAVAAAFSLTDLLDRPPQALSRGQRLRVAVAAALTAEPTVLLLDEPTAGQDLEQVERMMLATAATLHAGVLVFATHDLALARRHATRVLALQAGRLRVDGEPQAVLAEVETWLAGAPAAEVVSPEGRVASEAVVAPEASAPGATVVTHSPLDPRVRLALVALVGVLAVALDNARPLALLLATVAIVFVAFGPGRRTILAALGALVALTWSTVLAQGMFYAEHPRVAWVSLGPLTLYREGVQHGLVQSLRFSAMTLAGFALAASTPPERLFSALRALRVSFGLSFLVVTALRLVPDVAAEWMAVRDARARRGRPAWRRPPWAWVRLEASLLAPLLARTLRRARALAESLDARGFDPAAPRAVRRPLVFSLRDRCVLGGALIVTMAVALPRVLYALYTSDTWYHPALRGLYAGVRGWL